MYSVLHLARATYPFRGEYLACGNPPMTNDFRTMITQNPPAFARSVFLDAPRPEDAGRFFTGLFTENQTDVDLSRVRTTRNPRYRGLSWLGALESPDMDGALEALTENPGYYISGSAKDPAPRYASLDGGNTWEVLDGMKRTVVGRFFLTKSGLPPVLYGVERVVYLPDQELEREWPDILAHYPALRHSGYDVLAMRRTGAVSRETWRSQFTLDGETLDKAAVLALPCPPARRAWKRRLPFCGMLTK